MSITIAVLSVTKKQQTAKTGRSYESLEVAYKNLTFGGKVEGKTIFPFGATKDTFTTLANAGSNDIFNVEVVKNAQGYNDWVSARPGSAEDVAASSVSDGRTHQRTTGSTGGTVNSAKSNYETPEERAQRQVYIIRQSSIANAISTLSVGSKSALKVDEVLDVASRFEDFVFGTKPAATGVAGLMEMENDIPL